MNGGYNADPTRIFISDGEGHFTQKQPGVLWDARMTEPVDFDNDNDYDIVQITTLRENLSNLYIFENVGNDNFTRIDTGSAPDTIDPTTACDLNHDGYMDMVPVKANKYWLRNRGDRTFAIAITVSLPHIAGDIIPAYSLAFSIRRKIPALRVFDSNDFQAVECCRHLLPHLT